MATIRTSIALYDGVTSPLANMNRALNIVLNSFEAMQGASGRAIDTAAIQQAREELARTETALNSIEQRLGQADNQQNRFNQSLRAGGNAAGVLLSKIKSIGLTLGGMVGIGKVIGLSDQLASTTARLNLIVDDGGSIEELQRKVMASAQASRAAYFDTAKAIAKMGANAGAAFDTNDEVIAFVEQVNKQFAIGGATAEEQKYAMVQLTQAMGAGALRGEELNSILEQAPGIARAIEQYMGIAEGSIKQYAEQGLITSEVVKNALFAVADETNAKFESMPKTWAQNWNGMENSELSTFSQILRQINQIANTDEFQNMTNGILDALAGIAGALAVVFGLGVQVGSFLYDNWSIIAPVLTAAAVALLLYTGWLAGYNAVQAISNGLAAVSAARAAIKAGATLTEAAATTTATGAQAGLNAALLACPVTWIVIGILALVVAIVALCNWIAKTTGVAQTGFGVITGGINVAIQAVKNAALVVVNVVLGIWSALGAVCSNIGTAFHNVIAKVQGWFYGLLVTALTVVEGICAALNKLPFVEFDYSGISAKADEYAAKSAEAYGSTEDYTNVADAFSKGFNTFDTFTDGWDTEAFRAGAAWGDGVADKVGGLFNFDLSDPLGADGYQNNFDGIYDNTQAIADNTKQSKNTSDEELAYLRMIAERQAVNQFTTAEIKVEMHNQNSIANALDLDGIMDEMQTRAVQAMIEASEGVHI